MARNKRKHHLLNEPILHRDHRLPVTRREFLNAGLISGTALVTLPGLYKYLSREAQAALLQQPTCGGGGGGGTSTSIPFICLDLGGGANMAGSNVLIGGPNGQLDFLTTAGYSKMGIPNTQLPNDPANVNSDFGLLFHADSAFVRGMMSKTSPAARANTNGAVIPARSDNDTGNNPHNPMYGVAKYVELAGYIPPQALDLIGSQNSDSGGRSMAPAELIDLTKRPTKIDRGADAVGLIDTGTLATLLPDQNDAVKVMQTIQNISYNKIGETDNPDHLSDPDTLKNVYCGYNKTTDTVQKFGTDDGAVNIIKDTQIVNNDPTDPRVRLTNRNTIAETSVGISDTESIFYQSELPPNQTGLNQSNLFGKTAATMKLVVSGIASAGTIESGGYDYHDGSRATGEVRDFQAGQAIGAAIQYAHRMGNPLFLYVFSDGSLASNGALDNSQDGRGKGEWTGDNSSTAASFFLVYNPGGRPALFEGNGATTGVRQQLGFMRDSGSVETTNSTPGANNVNQLVQMVLLNYMALHGGGYGAAYNNLTTIYNGSHGLGDSTLARSWVAFDPIL